MKNVLMVCNTYSQLLIAIQIKLTIKSNDDVTVVITDQSNGSYSVFRQIKKQDVFEHVYYVKTKEFCKKTSSRIKALGDIIHSVFGYKKMFSFLPQSKQYNEMIFYNPDIATHCLFATIEKQNKHISISRFEEGIISYDNSKFPMYKKLKCIYMIRKVLKKKRIQKDFEKFYCFYPDYYQGIGRTVKIPGISVEDSTYKSIVSSAFRIDTDSLSYPCKYIYFSSVFDFEGEKQVDEVGLCKKISNLVGEGNLMVKVHPRDDATRFEKAGLIVDKKSMIPWEAIQLNYDFENYTFITIVSTSVITISSLVNNPPRICFVYKIFEGLKNSVFQSAVKSFKLVNDKGLQKMLKCLDVIENLDMVLDEDFDKAL